MIEEKLRDMGIEVPEAAKPLAAYIPALRVGNLIYTAGQIPLVAGKLELTGKVGQDVTLEQAAELAKVCAINGLAAIKSVIGDLDQITRIVKVTGFVNSAPGFSQQPAVIDGASAFFGEVFGEAGKHARSAVGVSELPANAPVEIEFIVEIAE